MKRLFTFCIWCIGLLFLLVAVTNLSLYLETRLYIYNAIEQVPKAEAVLIPGAAVFNGKLSPIFRDRVDTAIELYKEGKARKILVSGDNSTVSYNEVNPVRVYLLSKGVPDEDIFLDHAGFDTYSSMYRARDIFGVSSVIIASQSFHLSRCVFIARALGIQAYGMNADSGHILLRNYAREVLADDKALYEVLAQRVPKYLGEKIPITGDGRLYP